MYDGGLFVFNVMVVGKFYVFVVVNYCVGVFGFMFGKEVFQDGFVNFGYFDQCMGFEWVVDNIVVFGGDLDKVIIWGELVGVIFVWNQMFFYDGNINYKGKFLFCGVIMNLGSIVFVDFVDCFKGQEIYDIVVVCFGCGGVVDIFNCLCNLFYEIFFEVVNFVLVIFFYSLVVFFYLFCFDGVVLIDSVDCFVKVGKYVVVFMIIGD